MCKINCSYYLANYIPAAHNKIKGYCLRGNGSSPVTWCLQFTPFSKLRAHASAARRLSAGQFTPLTSTRTAYVCLFCYLATVHNDYQKDMKELHTSLHLATIGPPCNFFFKFNHGPLFWKFNNYLNTVHRTLV